jgi:hypothetical protein
VEKSHSTHHQHFLSKDAIERSLNCYLGYATRLKKFQETKWSNEKLFKYLEEFHSKEKVANLIQKMKNLIYHTLMATKVGKNIYK